MPFHHPDPADTPDESKPGRLDAEAARAAAEKAKRERAVQQRFKHLEAEIAERKRSMQIPVDPVEPGKPARRSAGSGFRRPGIRVQVAVVGATLAAVVAVALVPNLPFGSHGDQADVGAAKAVSSPVATTPSHPVSDSAVKAASTGSTGPASPAPTGTVVFQAPALSASRAAVVDRPWPAITLTTAFPDDTVNLPAGLVMRRLGEAKQTPCDTFASPQMSQLIDQGSGCAQLITALFTTPDLKAQFTIDVLSMNRAEDASTVLVMSKTDFDYQMGSMDPPPGVPQIPDGNGGVTDSVMAVRSVVFVEAQWVDPKNQDVKTLTAQADSLLSYVDAKVAAYETRQAG